MQAEQLGVANSLSRDVQWSVSVCACNYVFGSIYVISVYVLFFPCTHLFCLIMSLEIYISFNYTHSMVEDELFPCLRNFGMSFYAYNPVSAFILTLWWTYYIEMMDFTAACWRNIDW